MVSVAGRIAWPQDAPSWLCLRFATAFPVIVDQVTTLCGPGELIDVIVTERGIAINPRRQDLIDAVKGSNLPIRPLQEIKTEVERICGGARNDPSAVNGPSPL